MAASAYKLAALLSIGLIFSVATQLRLPNLPLGLGEILLLTWLFLSSGKPSNWRSLQVMAIASLTVLGAILLVAGYAAAYPVGHERPAALHDALAYAFCAVLAINFARLKETDTERIPTLFLFSFVVSFVAALALGWIAESWTGMSVWYHGERWQHLSDNPNQFALLALAVPFLAIHIVLRRTDVPWLAVAVGLLGVTLGVFSHSDALSLAWLAGGLVACVSLFGTYDIKRKRIVALLITLTLAGPVGNYRTEISILAPRPQPQHRPQPRPRVSWLGSRPAYLVSQSMSWASSTRPMCVFVCGVTLWMRLIKSL